MGPNRQAIARETFLGMTVRLSMCRPSGTLRMCSCAHCATLSTLLYAAREAPLFVHALLEVACSPSEGFGGDGNAADCLSGMPAKQTGRKSAPPSLPTPFRAVSRTRRYSLGRPPPTYLSLAIQTRTLTIHQTNHDLDNMFTYSLAAV